MEFLAICPAVSVRFSSFVTQLIHHEHLRAEPLIIVGSSGKIEKKKKEAAVPARKKRKKKARSKSLPDTPYND